MSILLEALRKSERNQRSHEVPTIHSDDEDTTVPGSLATGPLAMLLVSALFMSGWFIWHQYQAPASTAQPAVASTQEPAADTQQPVVGDQAPVTDSTKPTVTTRPAVVDTQPVTLTQQPPVTSAKDESATVTTPLASDVKATQPKPAKTGADKSAGKQRTPMESYKPPARSVAKTQAAVTERPAAAPAQVKLADAGNNQSTSADASVTKPVAVTQPTPRPETPRPISYWELPDAVRENVPEIKFSVLVYAANPSDRFVLINGQRLTEGDNAGPDLVVKEIRREGVIFSYRLYQFLVEK